MEFIVAEQWAMFGGRIVMWLERSPVGAYHTLLLDVLKLTFPFQWSEVI